MTLDEAIKRYISNAEYERTHGNLQGCLDFRQLVEWLMELKKLGEQPKWIPVSERLPESCGMYIVTRKIYDCPDTAPIIMSDEGITVKDVVISADKTGGEDRE